MPNPNFFAELKRRNVLRVGAFYAAAGWLLVQIATQVFPFFDIANWVVRLVVVAVIVGFPFALIFSWFYELTPEGLKRESDIAPSASITRSTGKTLDRWIIAVLALAVVVLLADKFVLHKNADAALAKSIAVLPLVNESGDPQQDYFSDGLSEELISALGQVHDLKVIGRNSSFQFRGRQQDDSTAIGLKLGVATLLEGTVRKLGDQVRIVASLINAADGSQLWSQTYDRELKDVFAVQSEIATAVAGALKSTLLGKVAESSDKPPDGNLGAYNALLQGNFYLNRLTEEDCRKAISYYDEAIRLDPRYALAYAGLSFAWRQLASSWLDKVGADAANAKARSAARTALALAPDLDQAHEALGWLLLTADLDVSAAEIEFRQALALAPSAASPKNALSYALAFQGQREAAADLSRQVIALEPLRIGGYLNRARVLTALGHYDEAEATLRKSIELQPTASRQYVYLTTIDLLRGKADAALRDAQREPEGFWRNYALALAQQASGDQAAADAALELLIEHDADAGPFQIAAVYALRKDPDHAFEWLDRAYTDRDSGLTQLLVTPFLLAYKNDPRFAALCVKLKIPAPGADTKP